jgi:hypothetical protein
MFCYVLKIFLIDVMTIYLSLIYGDRKLIYQGRKLIENNFFSSFSTYKSYLAR